EGVEAPSAPIEDTTQAWASGLMQRAFEAVRQHCRESGRDEVTTVLARTAFDGLKPSAIAEEHQWAVERVYEWLRSGKGLLKREVLNAIREYSLEDDVPQELQTLFASSGILNDDTN
ncbi:MAG: hypothetical protein KDB07_13810, partial [Planctomycetes bacterium]|nr:hypothetical protein [Planctomycetota bacterium]